MWLIKNKEKDQIYKIKTSRENTVSRKDGDLLLCGDQSISRQHAVLKLSENGQKVILKDLGSKYGTSIKHKDSEFKKAKANEEILLNVGDIIRFGIQSNLWKLEYFPIVVTTSTLGQEEKTELRQIISTLDGTIVGNWSPQCTHLVMNQLTVTVKVVCALADCRSIVTPAYFRSLHQCITTMQLPLPNVNDFVPKLIEATLNPNEVSFIPNLQRKILFSGTVFVASTLRQLARIEIMITGAGGKVEEFVSTKAGIDKYLSKGYVLMMHSAIDKQSSQESQIPNGYINIAKMLKNQGIRCIPEPEIGLSILYCSMEQYCNPRFKIQIIAQHQDSCEQTKEPSAILVPETQEKPLRISCSNMEIPETCSLSGNKAQSRSKNNKKRVCDKELQETISQKRACRRQNADEDLFASPSPQPSTSSQTSESSKRQPSTVRSPNLFSFSIEKDISIAVDSSKEHSKSSDPFNFPSKNTDNVKAGPSTLSLSNTSKRLNSSTDIFSSIVEKNKRRKSQDSDFIFPSEREENQCKTKRNRDEDSEFDFLSEWEDKRPKLNSVVNNKKENEKKNNSLFDNGDPFNFTTKKVEPSKTIRKKTNSGHSLWHSMVNEVESEHTSKNQKAVRDKTTDNLSSDDETNPPKVQEEWKDMSFQVFFDEEVKKKLPKPIPLSSFISKQTVKKEIIEAEEEEEEALAERLNLTCEVQVKCLVVITTPLQEVPPRQSTSNIVNFKKFKKKQTGVMQRLPCIIGGSDLIPHEVY